MGYKRLTDVLMIGGLAALLFACSGGEDGPIGTGGKLVGTAAEGAPLANVVIQLKDSTGLVLEKTTDDMGRFEIIITDTTPPFLLSTTTPNGKRLFSVVTDADTSNNAVTRTNVHPLSDIVARNWFTSRSRNIESEFDTVGGFQTPALEGFQAQINALIAAIKNLLALAFSDPAFAVPADFNFMSSEFSADATGFDKVLDYLTIKFVNVNGRSELTIRLQDPATGYIATLVLDYNLVNDLSDVDQEAPTTPTNPIAFAVSANSAILLWNASVDNIGVAGYRVYRDGAQIATTPYPVYSDGGLIASDPNCFSIEAFDGAGNTSQRTADVCVTLPTATTPPDVTAPAAASDLVAIANSPHEISLTWTPSQDNDVQGYDIFRGSSNAVDLKIATVFISSFEDFNLFADAEYCYKVVAIDFAGNRSADSNSTCVTTPALVSGTPSATPNPPNVSGSTPTNLTQPTWMWSTGGGNGNGTFRYKLGDSNFDTGATTGTATSFTPASALPEGSHTLYVQEQNDTGVFSNSGSFTIVIDITAPQPAASPQGGTFTQATPISLGCSDAVDANCQVYFTLDGTEPSVAPGFLYTSPIQLDTDSTVTFLATDEAGNTSTSVIESYVFNIPTPDLSLSVISSDATATISSDVGGINCGSVCSAVYAPNTQVTLTYTHPQGYAANWTGCTPLNATQCRLNIDANTRVSVSYLVSGNENEINDSFADANVVNSNATISGFYNSTTDNDYYRIDVSAPGTLYATLSHSTVNGYLYLYDANQVRISNTSYATVNTLTRSVTAGTYYIRVFPLASQFDVNNPYELRLSGSVLGGVGPDQYEENDSFGAATAITTAGTYMAYYDTVNDSDYYRIEVSAPGTLYMRLAHSTVSGYIYLYDSTQTRVSNTSYATVNTLTRSVTAGTYYVRVVPFATQYDVNNAYSLELTGSVLGVTGPDQYEENDSFGTATAITTSGTYTAYYDTVNDSDYYRINVSSPGTLYMRLAHSTVSGYIYLYDSTQTRISNTSYATVNTLTRSVTAGTYYVRVVPFATQFDVNNAYSLELTGSVLGVTGPDQYEENDSFGTATAITTDGTYTAYYDTVNDSDYYRINVSSPGTLYMRLAHSTVSGYIYLYDSTQTRISNTNYATVNTLTRSVTAGTYYVRVVPFATQFDVNNAYSLELTGSVLGVTGPDQYEENDSFGTATSITTDGVYTGYYDTVNDSDYYRIEVSSPGTLYMRLAHSTVSGYIYLYDSNQTRVTNTNYATQNTLTQSVAAGTYYVRVFPFASQFDVNNSYSLELSGSVLGVTGPDQYEANDTFGTATPISASGTFSGYYDTVNDSDYYRIEVTSPGTLYMRLSHSSVNGYIYLYDANQARVSNTNYATVNTLTRSVTAGTYYVRVSPLASQFDVSNAYSLELSGSVLGDTGPDQYEENDSFATAAVISENGSYQGYYDTVNDEDYYQIVLATAGTLTVSNSHNTVNGYIYLYGANQARIANTNYGTANTLTQVLTAGTYYVRILPLASQYDANTAYTMNVSVTP
ncbi:MAG: chitobiase/beta-hexosaminidase C-terminal domain-containing protein [Gammaproteobacteria bacterium]|nr:chitobiase/beta-hexosaminidase C-terminal domain-containing protein [Gammaproteobacteria bacterium]MDH5801962.1 chitobiase/beta-hexosaminidase C-terminal domain-containing protein [Gammaproteobacteria bacterium]